MTVFKFVILAASLALSGCSAIFDKEVEWEYVQPDEYPVIRAVGYAPISAQHGDSMALKTIQAVKASKLDAYRELTEQVYGQKIEGNQQLSNLVLSDDGLKSSIQGVIRGAQVVKAYAVDDDTYVTELELDFKKVYNIYLSTARPKRIKQVNYY
ncbi:LPP20 family lipoprotein [Neptunicella sp. SCSIO 80796]|uniref:LPP20 family lipoprotein n=1 Tax=Neptunicella plasticusilytica TaxID=3117012 RepID=UPI003A4E09F2